MKVRLVSSIAIAGCVACLWQRLAAEEEIKYPSPDGKLALRITEPTETHRGKIALIEKASGEVIIDLESDRTTPSVYVHSAMETAVDSDGRLIVKQFPEESSSYYILVAMIGCTISHVFRSEAPDDVS